VAPDDYLLALPIFSWIVIMAAGYEGAKMVASAHGEGVIHGFI
jgi:hypothetical protein